MNPILCALTTLTVVLSSFFWLTVQDTTQTPVGEIVEIGCKKSWRLDESKTKHLLNRRTDKGRKIFEGEGFLCEGKGILKLVVHSRPVDVTEEMGLFSIGKAGGPNKPNTAGSEGEELAWLRGTYRLNIAESDDSGKGGESFSPACRPNRD
jgi:hypothetical protein